MSSQSGMTFPPPAASASTPHPLAYNRTGSSLAFLGPPYHLHMTSITTITPHNHPSVCTLTCLRCLLSCSILPKADKCLSSPHTALTSLNTKTSLILPLSSCPFRESGNCTYSSSLVLCCFACLSPASSSLLKLILLRILIISIVTNRMIISLFLYYIRIWFQ